ncbi:MAG: hypothetical protein C0617_16095 [Desulfuromonas sp.]|uniref:hypothetical protein n=1 Tax=Desulfuromonas sp. TaxID=892 RepID=UPI000CC5D629|nr:hypothetical protein [Desulfuromonas sp.]PLX81769.1 MAG: hypothetical protein C0617_16095 [Desulfuromonas sp.]
MSHTVAYSEKEGIIRVCFQGVVSAEDVGRATLEAMELGAQHLCRRFLTDYRQAEFRASLADVFGLAGRPQDFKVNLGDRFAIIVSEDTDTHQFFRTVLYNRMSLALRYFVDPAEALSWLLEEERADAVAPSGTSYSGAPG